MIRIAPAFAIDPSTLPFPPAIKALNYDAIVVERGVLLKAKFAKHGVAYDVETLETDPGMILQQVDAERELLDKAAINDAVRAVLPAFAKGADLDHIVARANVVRRVLTPADPIAGTAAVMESDESLLVRYLESFSAPAAGSVSSYIARAVLAWPQAHDIRPLGPAFHRRPGRVEIVLLAAAGAGVPDAAIAAVFAGLQPEDARPMTDDTSVRPARVNRWTLSAHLQIPRGADASAVVAQARTSAAAFGSNRYFIGGAVPANAAAASLYVPNIERAIVTSPLLDLPVAGDAAPFLEAINITHEVV